MGDRAMSGEPDNRSRHAGSLLLRFSKTVFDDDTLRCVVTPTLADLQHEVESAGPSWPRRSLAYLRGCAGLSRVLVTQLVIGRLLMRRWVTVLALGIVGAALLVGLYMPGVRLRLLPGIAAWIAPFLLPAIVIPVVLRRLGLGKNFRQMFVNCAAVGTTMMGAFFLWVLFVVAPHPRLSYPSTLGLVFVLGCIVFLSALTATLSAERTGGGESRPRTAFRNLIWSAVAFGISYAVFQLRLVVYNAARFSVEQSAGFAIQIVCTAVFLAFFFAAVEGVVYYPVMLTLRRLSTNRLLLAIVGGVLFPIPWEVYALVRQDPHLHMLPMLMNPLAAIVPLFLPLVIGGAVFGWTLASRREDQVNARQIPETVAQAGM